MGSAVKEVSSTRVQQCRRPAVKEASAVVQRKAAVANSKLQPPLQS